MAKVELTLQASKEAHELAKGLAEILLVCKEALADGWQPLTDAPKIVISAVSKLGSALGGLDQLDDEFKDDPAAFINAVLVPLSGAVASLLKAKA